MSDDRTRAADVLRAFELQPNCYVLGCYQKGVTIRDQQCRALNLAWAMTKCLPTDDLGKVAIIGAGFAGMTLGAGLLRKRIPHITLFEKRPTHCPLQQGSDARWVHPHIYEWPDDGCDRPSAGLPVLNWKAGRASDVAADLVREWDKEKRKAGSRTQVSEVMNVQYLRLEDDLTIDWKSADAQGRQRFASVVIAVGYGIESGTTPYWRNDALAQPELTPRQRPILISGYGDGALIDLFRATIQSFRQDRILEDFFGRREVLIAALKAVKSRTKNAPNSDLLKDFEDVAREHAEEFEQLVQLVRKRLRKDTQAILRIKDESKGLHAIFGARSSFQNKWIAYLLLRASGFIPSHDEQVKIKQQYVVDDSSIILRHGTAPHEEIERILAPSLLTNSSDAIERMKKAGAQTAEIQWEGGYWKSEGDEKGNWRKEYLPDATEVAAGAFVSAISGLLGEVHCDSRADWRVTLHRVVRVGPETLLQQACPYYGCTERNGEAARTFRTNEGLIGLAYREGRVCRTRASAGLSDYQRFLQSEVSNTLAVGEDAKDMAPEVKSLLAVPIMGKSGCAMVVFADSTVPDLFSDDLVRQVVAMCDGFGKWVASPGLETVFNYADGLTVPEPIPVDLKIVEQLMIEPVKHQQLVGLDIEWKKA